MNHLHPIMAAALAGFMPLVMTHEDDEDEDLDIETPDDEPHEVICNACSGSGEGQHEGTSCRVCKGLGEVWVTE